MSSRSEDIELIMENQVAIMKALVLITPPRTDAEKLLLNKIAETETALD